MTVNDQLVSFVLTVGIGLVAGFFYDFYRVVRDILRLRKTGLFVGDLIYWLALTAVVFVLLLLCNQGEMRFYVLLGLSLGAFLHMKFLSPGTRRIILFLFRLAHRALLFIQALWALLWRVVTLPFKIIFLSVVLPCRWTSGACTVVGRGTARLIKRVSAPARSRMRDGAARFSRLFGRGRKNK